MDRIFKEGKWKKSKSPVLLSEEIMMDTAVNNFIEFTLAHLKKEWRLRDSYENLIKDAPEGSVIVFDEAKQKLMVNPTKRDLMNVWNRSSTFDR